MVLLMKPGGSERGSARLETRKEPIEKKKKTEGGIEDTIYLGNQAIDRSHKKSHRGDHLFRFKPAPIAGTTHLL